MAFVAGLLLFQAGVRADVSELRQYLGATYPAVVALLNAKNQILLRNTEPLAPAQAAQMRAQMQLPQTMPAEQTILPVGIENAGQGLLTFLFEDDFIVEQVNFVFCPAGRDSPAPARVMALQVLLDDRRSFGSVPDLLRTVYQMPAPAPAGYRPVLMYPLIEGLPATVWDLGTAEALYQPVAGERLVTGQFWLADKNVAMQCAQIPKLPKP